MFYKRGKTPDWRKTCLIMKLSVWLLFVLIIPVSATSYSQNKKLTHAFKNSSLKEVFQLIEEELDYSIVYKDELIGNHLFSGHFQNANAPEVLDRVLEGKPLAYKTVGEIILIIPKGNEQVQVQNVITVTGTVTDAYGEPLPGVNVYDKNNSTNGVITNIDGQYTITVKNESILKFSFIGFADQEIEVAGRTSIKVTLVEETTNLEEVVAVGYGTMKKANLIGSVSKINSEAIAQKPVANVTQALQGASANLILQQPTMEPGTSASINIRGVSTMNNNSPLVVIDGLVGGDLNSLNPADIESVSILKDAGSAAIYGSRSANGVILVTTKKGNKKGKPTVTATAQVGIQDVSYEYRPVAGYKNAMLRNEALANVGSAPLYSPDQIRDLKENGDSEWFLDQILRNAMQENYSFNMSGGNDNSTYMVSAGYMNQENNFVGDDYGLKRYNFRMNMTNEYGKFKLITNMAYSRTLYKNHTTSTNNLIVDASRIPNYYYYQMKDASGRYYINDVLTEFSPLGILEAGGTHEESIDNFTGNTTAELSLFEGFKLKGVFGADIRAIHKIHKVHQVKFYSSPEATEHSSSYGAERATNDDNEKALFLNSQIMAQYNKNLNNLHDFSILLGASNESYTRMGNGIRTKYTDQDLNIPVSETEIIDGPGGTYTTPQSTTERSLYSAFGRLNYELAQKYLVELNFRYDGSSKFHEDQRWGFFPSAGLAWRASEEGFLSFYRDNISNLKLRASYGILGNQNVSDYQYQTTYSVFNNAYGFNNTAVAGTNFLFANPDLTWEKCKTLNLGVDATFFNNKLSVTADYFNKLTSDILIPPSVPGTYGGSVPVYNAGEMRNQGWDLTIDYHLAKSNWRHNFSLNLGDSWNEVVKYEGGLQINGYDQMQRVIKEGLAYNSYLGYKTDGYFQNYDEIKNSAKPLGAQVAPGDVRYKDKNGDGVIDDKDRYILGNAFPRYTFGFTYDVKWKNFDFSTLIQGVGKRDMFLRGELVEPFHSNYSYVMYEHQMDYWTPINTDAKYPRLTAPGSASNSNNYGYSSDLYLFDASYIRLKNITVGYTLPNNLTSKIGVKSLRIYVQGNNLLTLSNLDFYNPESTEFNGNMSNGGANSGRSYPTLKYYGGGIDIKF